MNIEINATLPIEWNKTYYLIGNTEKNVYAPCAACDSTGKVSIKGEEYPCPRCHGNWREKEIASKTRVYHVEKYRMEEIRTTPHGTRLFFKQINSKSERNPKTAYVRQSDFSTMKTEYSGTLTDDYGAVMAEVKRLNAEVKAQ